MYTRQESPDGHKSSLFNIVEPLLELFGPRSKNVLASILRVSRLGSQNSSQNSSENLSGMGFGNLLKALLPNRRLRVLSVQFDNVTGRIMLIIQEKQQWSCCWRGLIKKGGLHRCLSTTPHKPLVPCLWRRRSGLMTVHKSASLTDVLVPRLLCDDLRLYLCMEVTSAPKVLCFEFIHVVHEHGVDRHSDKRPSVLTPSEGRAIQFRANIAYHPTRPTFERICHSYDFMFEQEKR